MARILSSEDSKNVGRPGFGKTVPGPTGKKSVRRLMRDDPSVGITQPGADVITDTHIDLAKPSPQITGTKRNETSFASGKKKIRSPRQGLRKR
jgi:hypothetical protein